MKQKFIYFTDFGGLLKNEKLRNLGTKYDDITFDCLVIAQVERK